MRRRIACAMATAVLAGAAGGAVAQPALERIGAIEMPGVKGRIDHFAVDVRGHRLFVAALGNDTVEVLDLSHSRQEKTLAGFHEPQGLAYAPEQNRLYVANAGGGVDVLDARSLARVRHIGGLDDADNVRYDAQAGAVLVGYGEGALRILDATTAERRSDIPLAGHPESFQLERSDNRVFVNVPAARKVAVVDRRKLAVTATWPIAAKANFPMALDEEAGRLFVGTRSPPAVFVYDTRSGATVARISVGADTDDLFFDAERQRLYVVCGEGRVDVFRRTSPDKFLSEGFVKTAPRARTGLFVPEEGRLYVAAPADGRTPARVIVLRARGG